MFQQTNVFLVNNQFGNGFVLALQNTVTAGPCINYLNGFRKDLVDNFRQKHFFAIITNYERAINRSFLTTFKSEGPSDCLRSTLVDR
jgi:hypothetical protein